MTLIAYPRVPRKDQRAAAIYIEAVVANCGSANSYRTILNPLYLGIAASRTTPPTDDEYSLIRERFRGMDAIGLLSTEECSMSFITNDGLKPAPMFNITHVNPALLRLVHEQEMQPNQEFIGEADPIAWVKLPKLIQSHWNRFNNELRTHIMNCMMAYLQKHPEAHAHHLEHTSSLFINPSLPHFPHIPVRQSTSGQPCDLMDILARLDRVNLTQLLPTETHPIKARINTPSLRPV